MIINQRYLLFSQKLLFSKLTFLKDLSTIYFKHAYKLPYAEIFIWVMRYDYVTPREAKVSSYQVLSEMSIAASINLNFFSINSLKGTNLSDYAVLQICLVKRACTAVHCQLK